MVGEMFRGGDVRSGLGSRAAQKLQGVYCKPPGALAEMQALAQEVWAGLRFCLSNKLLVMPVLLLWGPHFEWPGPKGR